MVRLQKRSALQTKKFQIYSATPRDGEIRVWIETNDFWHMLSVFVAVEALYPYQARFSAA